jgi:hypothetical protein
MRRSLRVCTLLAALPPVTASAAGELTVRSTVPANAALNVPARLPIIIRFDQPLDPSTVNALTVAVFGRVSGPLSGSYQFEDGGSTLVVHPDRPFFAGETVTVNLSHDLAALGGSTLRQAGWFWRYTIQARPAALSLSIVEIISTSQPGEGTTPYGGSATDLDRDGWADLVIVNEETNDLRVFMNAADGTCELEPFALPTTPVGNVPSPSETADFNRDGLSDLVVANTQGSSISFVMGQGDGTYGPAVTLPTPSGPRGVAVLDLDGDGDLDVATANFSASNVSLFLNDGSGNFSLLESWDAGAAQEWGLAAADMNNDGIADLVVGARSGKIIVKLGAGDGTFGPPLIQNSGGAVWMIGVADLNGDGIEDVASANSNNNNGSILLGTGGGALAAPVIYAADPFPLATDVADLDGDGDLDWILSSFNGDWRILLNDGQGSFTLLQELPSTLAASCSIAVDLDNDGDIDLALIDELADQLVICRNSGFTTMGDLTLDGLVDGADLGMLLSAWGQVWRDAGPPLSADLDGDGVVGGSDLGVLLAGWSEEP